ncbi:MAG: hypothetical protein ACLFSY_09560 [Desulfonatronovibrionaceae bacterium]
MFKDKTLLCVAVLGLLFFPLVSCTQVKEAGHGVGKATGKSVKTMKEMPRELKEGYKEGRTEDPAPEE